MRGIAIPGALGQSALAAIATVGAASLSGLDARSGLVLGIAVSVASTVVLLRVLMDFGLVETGEGRVAIGWLVVEDIITVLVIVLLPVLATGGAESIWSAAGLAVLKLAALGAVMAFAGARFVPWLLLRVARLRSRELFTLTVLVIAMAVATLGYLTFGASMALGAFLAGMVVGQSKVSHQAAADALPMRDAFAVLFLVSVGMLLDPAIVLRHPLALLATLAIIVVGKSIAALAIVRLFGWPSDVGLTIAASLAQIGEFSFILAGLGADLGLLGKEGRDLILAGAILSICLNPLLFTALDGWFARRAGKGARPAREELPAGPPLPSAGHIVLVGFGRVGSRVGRALHEAGHALALIESDRDLLDEARALGIAGLLGNASAQDTLAAANIGGARAVVIAIPQTIEAGQIIEHARAQNSGIAVLARAHSDRDVDYLLAHGADLAIMGEREIARSLCESVESLTTKLARLAANPA